VKWLHLWCPVCSRRSELDPKPHSMHTPKLIIKPHTKMNQFKEKFDKISPINPLIGLPSIFPCAYIWKPINIFIPSAFPINILLMFSLCPYYWLHFKTMDHLNLPITYKGVVVSLNPRKIPCMAKERSTAGAPKDLNLKYLIAGFSIGEFYTKRKSPTLVKD